MFSKLRVLNVILKHRFQRRQNKAVWGGEGAPTRIYKDADLFGPTVLFLTPSPAPEMNIAKEGKGAIEKQQKADKDLIKKGYIRVQEKIKEKFPPKFWISARPEFII